MAMAKSAKAAQLRRAAERMDWLMANARILRSPALWEKYYEAQRIIRLLCLFDCFCNKGFYVGVCCKILVNKIFCFGA